jgi:ArsR family transcriptional regulator, virulence genes transcriptional regulator
MLLETDQMNLMRQQAAEAATMLRLIGNEHRLIVLCSLVEGEMGVGALQDRLDLSQSALSQHLARLRADGLISARRASQNIYYSIADEKIFALIAALAEIFCPDEIKMGSQQK